LISSTAVENSVPVLTSSVAGYVILTETLRTRRGRHFTRPIE
jgi:hypothetical protein